VTFPILLPAVLATLILLIIRGIETFETPAILGVPAGIMTFVTEIWINTSTTPTDLGLAATYAVLVLLLCLGLVLCYNRATRHSAMFTTVSGKAYRPRITDLGRWRWPWFGFAIAVMSASVLLPMLVLLWSSVMPRFTRVSAEALGLVTFQNYLQVLQYPLTRRAFLNSSFLGITSASATVFLISIVAWLTIKTRIRGRQLLDLLAFAPIAIPSIMMGVAFLWLYIVLPVPVYGTLGILFLFYLARYMPVVMRILSASIVQIGNELHEAAEVTGATWWRSFRTITLPLLRPGLVASWIFVLIHAFRELSGSLILYSAGNEPIGVAIFDLWEDGSFPLLSAFGVIVFAVLVVLSLVAQRLGARFGVRDV
jgi:iron(III) transport system permease protein